MRLTASPVPTPDIPPAILQSRAAFEIELVEIVPNLRAFARRLTHDDTLSDDLVQDTLVNALRAYRGFEMGTNMRAWAFTILRNLRQNDLRRQGSNLAELDDAVVLRNPVAGNQEDSLALSETLDAMNRLSPVHREVLTLVRALGHNYEQTARIMACPMGTIKSRLNRADAALRAMVESRAAP